MPNNNQKTKLTFAFNKHLEIYTLKNEDYRAVDIASMS